MNEPGDQPVVSYEPVEFEKVTVEGQDFRKIINQLTWIYRIYLILIKRKLKDDNMSPVGLGNY